jgi:hypothetical protein
VETWYLSLTAIFASKKNFLLWKKSMLQRSFPSCASLMLYILCIQISCFLFSFPKLSKSLKMLNLLSIFVKARVLREFSPEEVTSNIYTMVDVMLHHMQIELQQGHLIQVNSCDEAF